MYPPFFVNNESVHFLFSVFQKTLLLITYFLRRIKCIASKLSRAFIVLVCKNLFFVSFLPPLHPSLRRRNRKSFISLPPLCPLLVKEKYEGFQFFTSPLIPSLRRRGKRGGQFGCGYAALRILSSAPLYLDICPTVNSLPLIPDSWQLSPDNNLLTLEFFS